MRASDRLRHALGLEAPAAPRSTAAPPDEHAARLQQRRREVERISRRYAPASPAPAGATPLRSAVRLGPRSTAALPPAVDPDGLLHQHRFAPGEKLGRQPIPSPGAELCTSLSALLALHGLDEGVRAEQILFLDLETTGLSRAAGTLAFIIGLARFEEDGALLVEQILLRDPAKEEAALGLLAPRLEQARLLVTYNGRGFDLPILRNRALLCRVPLALERDHVDLLPLCRRLFRARLPSCRLLNVERELLGLERVGDIAGAEAPLAYSRFLAEGRVEELLRVLEHNRLDVAVLAGVLLAVSRRAADPLHWAEDAEELLALGLMQLRGGHAELGEACLGRGLELSRTPGTGRRLLTALARQLRRRGLRHEASLLWERHCREFPEHGVGWTELAKYHEHTAKDLERALAVVEQAPRLEEREHRLARLRRRLGLPAASAS